MKEYDVIVIGSGGGAQISSSAFELGKTVAVIEKGKLGGTCLNRGCIPSKMLIPANVASLIRSSDKLGLSVAISSIDLPGIITRINRTTNQESNELKKWHNRPHARLKFYQGSAVFVSNKVISVNGQRITGKKIYLATGASPFTPPIPGLDQTPYWTSTEALRAEKAPKKLMVIGGGYIACELGYAFSALGSEVHWLVRDAALLTREDQTVSQEFTKIFSGRERVLFKVDIIKVEYRHGLFFIHLKSNLSSRPGEKHIISGDALLVATGVSPNTAELGLENTSIKTTKRGFIAVNSRLETNVKDVFAFGDCVGNYLFRHSVNFEGEFLFKSHFIKKNKKPIKYPPMPHAVFTNPEIGSVGKTELELSEKKIPYVVGFALYQNSGMGQARLSREGFVKLLFHQKTRKLLGAHILGEEASNMIHQLVYAITFKATVDNLLEMIYIHPALTEIVRNAARNALDSF